MAFWLVSKDTIFVSRALPRQLQVK